MKTLLLSLFKNKEKQTPAPCDQDIYERGYEVCVLDGKAEAIELIIQHINKKKIVKLDWHYFGGRAIVKTLDDHRTAKALIEQTIPKVLV